MDDYISMLNWHKDHWSTLAYVETVMVDNAGFQLGTDAHMRSNRRNFRVMAEACPRPKRASGANPSLARVMQPQHTTRLKDGSPTDNHDDWACIQDMAAEGLFTVGPEDVQPAVVLHLSERGQGVCNALRAHKAAGGHFAGFDAARFSTQVS